jgi:hypothetical protein
LGANLLTFFCGCCAIFLASLVIYLFIGKIYPILKKNQVFIIFLDFAAALQARGYKGLFKNLEPARRIFNVYDANFNLKKVLENFHRLFKLLSLTIASAH